MPWLSPKIPHFEDGGLLPAEYAARSPPITWSDPGTNVLTYAVFFEDLDAIPPRIHWCVFDLPERLRALPGDVGAAAEVAGGKQAMNDLGQLGYSGPASSPSAGRRFRFLFYAVTTKLGFPAGTSAREVLSAISGKVSQLASRTAVYAGQHRAVPQRRPAIAA